MGKNKKVNLKIDDDDNQEKMNFSDHSSFFKEKSVQIFVYLTFISLFKKNFN